MTSPAWWARLQRRHREALLLRGVRQRTGEELHCPTPPRPGLPHGRVTPLPRVTQPLQAAAGEASASLGPVGSIPKVSPTWAGTAAAMTKLELCPGGAEVVSSAKS